MDRELSKKDIKHINDLEDRRISALDEAGIDERTVLDQARKDVANWDSYFNENITRGQSDVNFTIKDQWTALERGEFTRLQKTPLQFNKIYDSVKKICGEQRKYMPDLMVRSRTGKATQQELDLRSDLVRNISYNSQTELVYQTAFKNSLLTGYGAFEIDVDYESEKSFDKVVKFNLISDISRTTFDPTAEKPHKGDGNYCARTFVFSKDEFRAQFPHIQNPVSYADPRSLLNFQWETSDSIVLCKYTVKEWYNTKIFLLNTGEVVTEDEWKEINKRYAVNRRLAKSSLVVGKMIMDDIPRIVAERNTKDYKIRQYKLTQNRIIEFMDWPSKYLPIIFVDGDSNCINGIQYTKSYVHEAKDAQRFVNYVGSEILSEIKNRRREQWIGTADNIVGQEQMWRNPEVQLGMLVAKPDAKTGMMPQKQAPWDLSPALMQQFQSSSNDIREILGFHEESQGDQSNAQSGIAIANRQLAASMSSYIFSDNLNQAIEQSGRVILDLLPSVYGTSERMMNLTRKDGKTYPVTLNQVMPDGSVKNDLKAGNFDIEIDAGPSFAVQKSASMQLMLQICQANPNVFNLIADLIAKNMDLENMPQMVERLETLVPPDILAKERGQQPPPAPPNPQQMMMQQEMMMKQQELKDRASNLQLSQQKHDLEKAKLMLEAQELQAKINSESADRKVEMHKADLDYTSRMAELSADREHHRNF